MKPTPKKLPFLSAIVACEIASLFAVRASNDTWVGNTDATWSNAANWTFSSGSAVNSSGDYLIFGAAGTSGTTLNNDLSAYSFSGLTINSGAAAFTLSGNAITLTGALTNSAANTETISLAIGGTGSLLQAGTGALTLSGVNTFSGGLTVSNGTVNLNVSSTAAGGAAGSGAVTLAGGLIQNTSAGAVTVSNNIVAQAGTGSTIRVNSQDVNLYGAISGSGNLTGAYAGSGTHQISLNGDDSGFTGSYTVNNSSTLRFRFNAATAGSANGAWVLNNNNTDGESMGFGNGTIYFGSLAGSGQIRQDFGGATSLVVVGGLNTSTTFSGRILLGSSCHAAVTKVGTGAWTLSGANGYDGATTVENGAIIAGVAGAIPTAIALGDIMSVTNTTAMNPQLLSGAAVTVSPAVTVGVTNTLGNGATTFTLGGSTVNSSTFAGAIKLNQSLIVTQATGGTLTLSGGMTNFSTNALTVVFNNTGAVTNSIAAIDNGSAGGTVAVTENGPGTLALMANNTYTGATTVNGGTLLVNGSTAAGSAVSVTGSGSVIGGSGTVGGNTSVSSSGALTPRAGSGSSTTLTFNGNLSLSGAAANFTLSTIGNGGGANDEVVYGSAGTLTLSSSDTVNISCTTLDTANDYLLFTSSGGTVSMATMPTLKTNGVTVTPVPGNFVITNYPGSASVVLHYLPATSAPLVNSESTSPASLGHYQTTTVTVNVTPASGKIITNLSVTVDGLAGAGDPVHLTGPGGNGSGNWTGTFTAAGSLPANLYIISGLAQQNDGNTIGWSVSATVTNYSDVWNGAGGNNKWSTGPNWSVSYSPGTGDSVTMAGTTQTTNNLDSSLSLAALTFDGTAGNFDITNAASTLTLTGGVTNNSSSGQTLDVLVALAGSQTIAAAAGNVTINGGISGTGAGLTALGNGTVTLSGNNSYTGGTTISGSTLVLSGNNTAATGATVISGTLQLLNSNAVAGSALTLNNGSTLNLLADANTLFTNSGVALPAGAGNAYNIAANSLNSPAGNGHTLALAGISGTTASTASPPYVHVNSTTGDTLACSNGLALTGSGSGAWSTDELIFSPSGANVVLNGLFQSGLNGGILLNSSSTESLTINGNVSWVGSRTLFAEVLNGTLILNDAAVGTQSGANWGFEAILYSGTLCLNSPTAIIPTSTINHPSLLIYGGTLDSSSSGDVTLSGNPTIGIDADFTYAGTHSLNLGTGNVNLALGGHTVTVTTNMLTIGGSISDGGSGYSLTESGAGTLSLTGSNSYTGGTFVNGGTLALNAALTGTTATGTITVNDGGVLQVTAAGTNQLVPATLQLGSGSGATNMFVAVANVNVAPIFATNLTLSGVDTISIKSGNFQTGVTYPLIAYTTESGGGSVVLGSLPPLVQGYLTDNGSLISITITNVNAEIWSGAVNGTWDFVSLDWNTNGISTTYLDGAPVLFNDTATGTTTITNIPSVVSPFSITVSNNTKAYSFAGGVIGGGAALTKNGSATLTLAGTNTYGGGTTINNGTLQLGDGSAADGAVAGGITDNANLIIANPFDQTFGNAVTGSGNLAKTGSGTLTVSSANSFSGTNIIKQGTLSFSAANNLSTNTVVLGDTATGADAALQLTAGINVLNNITVASGAGARTLKTVGGSTFSGAAALNNSVTAVATGSGDMHLSSTLSGSGSLAVSNTTANIVWMDGPGSPNWTGAFIIQAGTVRPGTAGDQFNTNTVLSISSSNGAFLNVGGLNADLNLAGINDIAGATGGGLGGGSIAHVIVLGGSGTYTYSGGFSSAVWGLNVNLAGAGKQTLTGNNTYTGNTTINAGTLALSGNGGISNTPNIYIGGGATLDVSGLNSTFSLTSAQTLRNNGGTGIGSIVGNANLNTGSLQLNYTNGTPSLSVANGTLAFNANTTTVTVAGSVLPGGSYKLIAKGAGGSVAGTLPSHITVNGTGAPVGATLQINNGELYLVVSSSTAYLTNSITGNTLNLTWPAGQGWTLQAQTNSLSTGLSTTGWSAVSGAADGSYSIAIDPTKPAVFYRLTQ